MNVREIFRVLWKNRLLIVGAASLCLIGTLAYIFLAQGRYRAEILLKPADSKSRDGLSGQMGGTLASLAGLDISNKDSAESIAILISRDLTGEFIQSHNLLPLLFPRKWDGSANRWISSDPSKQPDIRDGIKYFAKYIRSVKEDRKTGLVTLAIEWKDSKAAADWANQLVDLVNEKMRQRALAKAEYNIGFLRQELALSNLVVLQQSIGRVLESELQKLLLAKGNKEFAFQILDHAQIPKWREGPESAILAISGFSFGLFLSMFFVITRDVLRREMDPNHIERRITM